MKGDKVFRFVHKLLPALWAAGREVVEAKRVDSDGGRKVTEDEREDITQAFKSHLPDSW